MHPAPRCGRIKGMMRIGHGDPGAKRLVLCGGLARVVLRAALASQVADGAVAYPGAVVPCGGQRAVVRLRSTGEGWEGLFVELIFEIALAIGVIPALVVQAAGGAFGQPVVMTELHQLHLIEAHVGAIPTIAKQV